MKKFRFLLPGLFASLLMMPTGRVTAQTFTTLHNFNGATDGNRPYAGVVLSGNTLYGTTFYGFGNCGELFAVNTDGTDFTNVHTFNNGGGVNPQGALIVSGDTLFGTTTYDNVFALTDDPTGIGNVHTFTCGTNDGCQPGAGVILSGNTLYGTTVDGGSTDSGTIFSVNTNGSNFSVLHSFTGEGTGTDGGSPLCVLVLSGEVLYGTAYAGGGAMGTLFAVSTNGTGFVVLHTFTGGTNGSNPQGGLALSGNTLYGTTFRGGLSGEGMVFKINTDGTGFADLHDFQGQPDDGYQPQSGVIVAGESLYGVAIQGGTWNQGAVYKLSTDGAGYTNLQFHGNSKWHQQRRKPSRWAV